MLLDLDKFKVINEKEAFRYLLQQVIDVCHERFIGKIGRKDGWYIEPDVDTVKALFSGIQHNARKIDRGEYSLVDIIDLINYAIMLYNLDFTEGD